MSEYQIINILHEMMMVVNAYRIKTNNFDFQDIKQFINQKINFVNKF